jgi:hypothetical protein
VVPGFGIGSGRTSTVEPGFGIGSGRQVVVVPADSEAGLVVGPGSGSGKDWPPQAARGGTTAATRKNTTTATTNLGFVAPPILAADTLPNPICSIPLRCSTRQQVLAGKDS